MRRLILLIIWLITDAVLFIGAYAVGYFLRVGFIVSTDFPLDLYLQTVAFVAPIWLLVMAELGVFKLFRVQSEKRNLLYILFSCIMASAMFTLGYYFLHDRFFSRLLLVYAGALSFVFTVIWHLAFDQWQRRVLRKNPAAYPVLIIGTNREAERIITLLQEKQSPLRPVGILDPAGTSKKDLAGVPVLGKLNKLEETLKNLRPKYLVQCSNLEHSINLIGACRGHGITYMLLPSVLGAMGGSEEFVQIEGQSMATVRE
jgi:FlaA1/EpsC-like NDP-sugar epimerase